MKWAWFDFFGWILLAVIFCGGSEPPSEDCPRGCDCKIPATLDCRSAGIATLPADYKHKQRITKLDLSHNEIGQLEPLGLRSWTSLEDLNLGSNSLKQLTAADTLDHPQLKSLSLQGNQLQIIPPKLFSKLPQLQVLRLDLNDLLDIENSSVASLTSLRHLRLDANRLQRVPTDALAPLSNLQLLNLGFNKIKHLPRASFHNLTSLVELILDYNQIETIDDDAFEGLQSLRTLGLSYNRVRTFSCKLSHTPFLHELNLFGNHMNRLETGVFRTAPRLTHLELRRNPLHSVDRDTFIHLPRLQKLVLSEVRDLQQFPNVNGSSALEVIRIDRARIRRIPSELCQFVPHLRSLELKSNLVEELPDLSKCKELRLLDLGHNRISVLPDFAFVHMRKLYDLHLSHNRIEILTDNALSGLYKLKNLDLSHNEIAIIESETFAALAEIQDINLGHNKFPTFPSHGLANAIQIKVHNNPHLLEFPSPESFPKVQSLVLSYAYHCCPFLYPDDFSSQTDDPDNAWRDSVIPLSSEHGIDLSAWAKGTNLVLDADPLWGNMTFPWGNVPGFNSTEDEAAKLQVLLAAMNIPLTDSEISPAQTVAKKRQPVQCIPEPSPFMPCHDLFDWWSLRCGVWVVFLMALLGNGSVVFVLIFSRSKIDVPRFLVCNLAAADFFMGIYLGFLAVVDASTLGNFRMHAIWWQFSSGCQLAGFLGVLSSELSVFTLAVITMERNYAITHAMHLNKRLSLRHAAYIMAVGWLFALVMATLPLLGVSDYRKFAVCLPFEVESATSLGYVVFLMLINGVAFLILMSCYLKMYCAIRGSQAWNSNDSRIAKRMALLVFTDFICWSPIAFFSLTAAGGFHLITLEQAKIFTVFILPLNSCCNPFLYAILTKQFKKDCVLICKAIEESRVTRGIGRCRHSSNFSNRHTPGNSNSAGDRNSSKGDGSSCHCQSRLHDKRNSRRPRWVPQFLHNWLRRIRDGQSDLENSSSANDYAYQIAEIQQKQQRKHRRAGSVSSENYSSSRSDSVKAIGCGIPMRMTRVGNRRRNSWTVTRKPSQDSNLSSSRNDSSTSAMTASTSVGTTAWRTSRSSVSSECGSSTFRASIRDRDRSFKSPNPSGAQEHSHKRSGSLREKSLRQHPMSPLAAGILRQQSVSKLPGSVVQRTVPQASGPALTVTEPRGVVSGTRPKPRLTRQLAVHDEHYTAVKFVSFDSAVSQHQHKFDNYCPLHRPQRLEGLWENSVEEDHEIQVNEPKSDTEDNDKDQRQDLTALYNNRDTNRLGPSSFLPRKLSTIPSRSCSVNPDNTIDDENLSDDTLNPSEDNRTTEPLQRARKSIKLISKSDNELYCQHKTSKVPNKMASVDVQYNSTIFATQNEKILPGKNEDFPEDLATNRPAQTEEDPLIS